MKGVNKMHDRLKKLSFKHFDRLGVILMFVANIITINCAIKTNKYSNDIVSDSMGKYSTISTDLRKYNRGVSVDDKNDLMYKYFDITNEELFYIRNENVSPEVSHDWMTGMIKQLKTFKKEKDFKDVLGNFKRIERTFDIDLDNVDEENISKEVIEKCIENLKNYNANK